MNKHWPYVTPGIPDDYFIRDEGVPMTKSEIRALSIAKLKLFPEAIVYDVGAGSGSVAVECKILVPQGRVFAIEKNEKALQLIKENSQKFQVDLDIVEGVAPEALTDLPEADRIFIGGSGGNLEQILHCCDGKLRQGGCMVLNSVTVNTGADAFKFFRDANYQVEAVQVNIAVSNIRGNVALWQARNPVTIIAAEKRR